MKNATKAQLESLLHAATRKVEHLVEENQILKATVDRQAMEIASHRHFTHAQARARSYGHGHH